MNQMCIKIRPFFCGLILGLLSLYTLATPADFSGEDGYRLWLKYDELDNTKLKKAYIKQLSGVYLDASSATGKVIKQELELALPALLGKPLTFNTKADNASLRIQLNQSPSALISGDGFSIQSQGKHLNITANTQVGLLYGTFHFLRLVQTEQSLAKLDITQSPKIQLRMLNHWDDLDRHTERGFAGESIFDWHKLPDYKEQRYYDYARANASIGINGIVPINVNSNALILSPAYLQKVQALADVFRPYGIKVYLSIKFSSPQQLDGLATSDPLDKQVQQWWQNKTAEIYKLIPDFGGFLVKANSEGQPGPGDYGRTHADGANMLAKALKPFGGNVLWRAFVYAHDSEHERSLQAYTEFVPLDGQFEDNVSVQVKNGPIDFQPREPFSPLFGAMPQTSLAMEFQVTQEYLGFSTHLAYLGTMYKEVLDADTHVKGTGSSVAKVIDGSLEGHSLSVMAGVANIGADRNWTGHIFGQANWYVLGRLAWDHELSAEQIAHEWVAMTLTHDVKSSEQIVAMMMASRENIVNYMTPLGLHHLMDTGHHYGPGPWVDNLGRADWNPTYYHRADDFGIGLDRTSKGTNGVSQYAPYWQEIFSDPAKTPDELLLWFHHLPWDYKMRSGQTLWQELVAHYYTGAAAAEQMQQDWLTLKNNIEPNQFNQVRMALAIQVKEAKWWRDACVLYFQSYSKMPLPMGFEKPKHSLEYYQSLKFPYAPGQG
ncbi:alpha-glucuronidase family glycosyl hydrolase [Paraglaciecola hydrolytica]|nr:alpha-glucuronidase family glycosyl hydrolase [Paraglaciecola hydrolytica]